MLVVAAIAVASQHASNLRFGWFFIHTGSFWSSFPHNINICAEEEGGWLLKTHCSILSTSDLATFVLRSGPLLFGGDFCAQITVETEAFGVTGLRLGPAFLRGFMPPLANVLRVECPACVFCGDR